MLDGLFLKKIRFQEIEHPLPPSEITIYCRFNLHLCQHFSSRFAARISDTPGPRHSLYPTPLNASATGVRLGDYIAFNNDLADLTNSSDPGPGNRTVIGLDSGYCVVTSVRFHN